MTSGPVLHLTKQTEVLVPLVPVTVLITTKDKFHSETMVSLHWFPGLCVHCVSAAEVLSDLSLTGTAVRPFPLQDSWRQFLWTCI